MRRLVLVALVACAQPPEPAPPRAPVADDPPVVAPTPPPASTVEDPIVLAMLARRNAGRGDAGPPPEPTCAEAEVRAKEIADREHPFADLQARAVKECSIGTARNVPREWRNARGDIVHLETAGDIEIRVCPKGTAPEVVEAAKCAPRCPPSPPHNAWDDLCLKVAKRCATPPTSPPPQTTTPPPQTRP